MGAVGKRERVCHGASGDRRLPHGHPPVYDTRVHTTSSALWEHRTQIDCFLSIFLSSLVVFTQRSLADLNLVPT